MKDKNRIIAYKRERNAIETGMTPSLPLPGAIQMIDEDAKW